MEEYIQQFVMSKIVFCSKPTWQYIFVRENYSKGLSIMANDSFMFRICYINSLLSLYHAHVNNYGIEESLY